jgi:hypothetical protein
LRASMPGLADLLISMVFPASPPYLFNRCPMSSVSPFLHKKMQLIGLMAHLRRVQALYRPPEQKL